MCKLLSFSFFSILIIFTSICRADTQVQQIYFLTQETGDVFRVNRDGTSLNNFSQISSTPGFVTIDPENRKLYILDGLGEITQSDLDGSNSITAVSNVVSPAGISIDRTNQKLYWTSNAVPHLIRRSNLDGSNSETVVSDTQDQNNFGSVQVDPAGAKIYWVVNDFITPQVLIRRADLSDGANVQTIVTLPTAESESSISLDLVHSKIYWSERAAGKIRRAGLDGSAAETVLTASNFVPKDLAVDPAAGPTIYTVDLEFGTLSKYDLSRGDNIVRTIADSNNGLSGPGSLALLFPVTLTPGTTITESPDIGVDSVTQEVTIAMQNFSTSTTLNASIQAAQIVAASAKGVRYDLTIRNVTTNLKKRIITKNSKVSTNLPTGTYSASYVVRSTEARSKTAKDKIVNAAKKKIAQLKTQTQSVTVINKIQDQKAKKSLAAVKTLFQSNASPDTPQFAVDHT